MPRNTLTAKDLGITAEDLATAGRVALAIHHHTSAHLDKLGVTKKADACRHAIADTLLHVSGWRTQREILASWRAWLYQRRKLTPLEAHKKRLEMCVSSDRSTSSKYTLQQTYTLLRHLAEEGSIRYVPRSKTDAGLIVWIGDAP